MPKALILGAGVMGCALTVPLAENGIPSTILGTDFDRRTVDTIQETGHHPGLDVRLPEGTVALQLEQADAAFEAADLIVVGVSSAGTKWAADLLAAHATPGIQVLSVTKGLTADADGTLRTIKHVFTDAMPAALGASIAWIAACGPSIASEVAHRVDTAVLFAGEGHAETEAVADLFRTDRYHVRTSTDMTGAEVCAATKNIFALAVGYGQGLGAKEEDEARPPSGNLASVNAGAALFTQSLSEMSALVTLIGGDPATTEGLAGTGDLFVTSTGGRNVRAGRFLGGGATSNELHETLMRGETIEGLQVLSVVGGALETLTRRGLVSPDQFPLTRFLHRVVDRQQESPVPWDRLLHTA